MIRHWHTMTRMLQVATSTSKLLFVYWHCVSLRGLPHYSYVKWVRPMRLYNLDVLVTKLWIKVFTVSQEFVALTRHQFVNVGILDNFLHQIVLGCIGFQEDPCNNMCTGMRYTHLIMIMSMIMIRTCACIVIDNYNAPAPAGVSSTALRSQKTYAYVYIRTENLQLILSSSMSGCRRPQSAQLQCSE